MSALPILNPNDGPAEWEHGEFIGSGPRGELLQMAGMVRRFFAVICPEVLGWNHKPLRAGVADRPVLLIHVPTGKLLAYCRHGAQGLRAADALIAGFPEFGLPLDLARLSRRQAEVVAVLRANGAVA